MSKMKRIVERIIESILTLSGIITCVIMLLIVLFLFKEGVGVFGSPSVEKGYSLYINSHNQITDLTSQDIKHIFDSDITNWEQIGGNNIDIQLFRFEEIFDLYDEEEFGEDYELLPDKLSDIITEQDGIIAYLPDQYAPNLTAGIKKIPIKNISLKDFFLGKEWIPTATPSPLFGVIPLILGTLLVSIVAILIALPLGLGVAIYLSELAGNHAPKFLKPTIELLAGIPSVVYGFFGLVVLVPIVQDQFGLAVGETAFTGSLLLAIMALPTIISVAEDAMRNTPRSVREASLALGATKWQTIYKVVIPYSASGISAAVVLGIGRAIGETMAVLMVTGNAAVIPNSLFEPIRTIPATIAAELGEAPSDSAHYQSLFLLGCILFIITMLISLTSEMISNRNPHKEI